MQVPPARPFCTELRNRPNESVVTEVTTGATLGGVVGRAAPEGACGASQGHKCPRSRPRESCLGVHAVNSLPTEHACLSQHVSSPLIKENRKQINPSFVSSA